MAVALNSKDLQALDKTLAPNYRVWDLLKQGAKSITESDFVGTREVRVNKMSGFVETAYKRNQDNARTTITVEKETLKLMHELWFAYDLDALDQEENPAYTIANVVEEHKRQVEIPRKDNIAVNAMYTAATAVAATANNVVEETITTANALASYDAAEAYALTKGLTGQRLMFVSGSYYAALKNADGISRSFTTNEVNLSGINRKVQTLDGGDALIIPVADSVMTATDGTVLNYIIVPPTAVAPIEKFNTVDRVPAAEDRNGYRDTVKGLNYCDAIVFDNAREAIYVSKKPTV